MTSSTRIAVAFIGLIVALVAMPLAYASTNPDDYAFYVPACATNESGAPIVSLPFPATFNVDELENGFTLNGFQDLLAVNANAQPVHLMAQDVDAGVARWWVEADTLPDGATRCLEVHLGNATATRDQAMFLVNASESVDVLDSASLDVTTNLTLEALGVNFRDLPSGTAHLVRKEDAYVFGVRSTDELFANLTMTKSEALNIDGDSDTGLIAVGCVNDWECVSDNNASTFVEYTGTGTDEGAYTVQNTAIPAESVINSVTVTIWGREETGGCGAGNGRQRAFGRVGANTSYGSYVDMPAVGGIGQSASVVMTTVPGTGTAWTTTDLNNLIAGVGIDTDGCGVDQQTTEIDVTVSHTSVPEVSLATITADIEYDLKMTYNGSTLALFVDGATVATDSVSGSIDTNTNDVFVGNFTGSVERVRIGSTSVASPTYVLDLGFEPDECTQIQEGNAGNDWTWTGTCEDQSASNNDATYTFVRPYLDGVSVDLEATVAKTPLPSPAIDSTEIDTVGPLPPLTGGEAPVEFPGRSSVQQAIDLIGGPEGAGWLTLLAIGAIASGGLVVAAGKVTLLGILVAGGLMGIGVPFGLYDREIIVLIAIGCFAIPGGLAFAGVRRGVN